MPTFLRPQSHGVKLSVPPSGTAKMNSNFQFPKFDLSKLPRIGAENGVPLNFVTEGKS